MFPPIFSIPSCCSATEDGGPSWRRHQERKLRMLRYWRDGIERQLAAVTAAITTLEQQIQRDRGDSQG